MNKKTLSISCITYNHEKFIAQAMDGFLMQKTTFDFEIVVGEDCSTDNTRRILLAYKEKYPDKIKLLLNEKNLGMMENGIQTGAACTGKYMALCEGDDYWTDPYKLQKQVDFLENNPDFALCHHRLRIIDEADTAKCRVLSAASAEVTTFEDLAQRQYILTASCVFRNKVYDISEELLLSVHGGDYAFQLLNAYHGKIKLIDEAMGVYRIHDQGQWSGRAAIDRTPKAIDTVRKCAAHFAPRAAAEFDFHTTYLSCFMYFEQKDFKNFRKTYRMLLKNHLRFCRPRNLLALSARYSLSLFPGLAGSYSKAVTRVKRAIRV